MKIEDVKLGQRVTITADKGHSTHAWDIISAQLLSKGVALGLRRTDSSERAGYFAVAYWFEVEAII
jgi:hypothetical protein